MLYASESQIRPTQYALAKPYQQVKQCAGTTHPLKNRSPLSTDVTLEEVTIQVTRVAKTRFHRRMVP